MNAIVPIRAGSQRVKNKNIFPINGKPLYTYIVETLKKVDQIDKIIINTDYKFFKELFADDPMIHVMERDKELRGNCNINHVIITFGDSFNLTSTCSNSEVLNSNPLKFAERGKLL